MVIQKFRFYQNRGFREKEIEGLNWGIKDSQTRPTKKEEEKDGRKRWRNPYQQRCNLISQSILRMWEKERHEDLESVNNPEKLYSCRDMNGCRFFER